VLTYCEPMSYMPFCIERHMHTVKQYRYNAEVCLKLASETKEIYAKMALIDLATEFRALAEDLEHLPRSV
jgi:uncharacterized damage-inducible protein DinB